MKSFLEEFDTQVNNLIQKNYHKEVRQSKEEYLKNLSPLKKYLTDEKFQIDINKGQLSFLIVIKPELINPEKAMSLIDFSDKAAVTKLFPLTLKDFKPIESVKIPKSQAYLLLDVDRGQGSRNIPPSIALEEIEKKQRSPLTIEEGIAILTHYPQFLIKNNCFSLLASRHQGDKRVPAIWINSQKQANLGWCWNGNPHTWLGSASAKSRVGFE